MHTTLYRFFDAQDRLLYVGIAGRPAERAHQHSKKKEWWSEVDHSTYEHFSTREAAAAAEVAAIVTEHPVYNVVHNGKRTTPDPRVEFSCVECGELVGDGQGYVQVDSHFAHAMFRAFGHVDQLVAQNLEATREVQELAALGCHANWQAFHLKCDPDIDSPHYWIAVDRLRTNKDLLDTEDHIGGKVWGAFTDIRDFIDFHLIRGMANAK